MLSSPKPGAAQNVGAGLPAKAVDQPALVSTDAPPSRASPLQQGISTGSEFQTGELSVVDFSDFVMAVAQHDARLMLFWDVRE
jgi:hypothetical protein